MSGYDGFGNFTRGFNWVSDKDADILITAQRMDDEFDIYAAALNQVILRNGVAPMSGDLKMGSNKVTGIASGSVTSPGMQFATDVTTGFWLAAAGVLAFSASGVERGRFTTTGFSITGKFGINTNTPRTQFDMYDGIMSIRGVFEDVAISSSAITGTVQIDYKTSAVFLYTSNAAGNFTFNVRGDGSTSLDSMMATGQMLTFAVEVPQGATPYYCTAITIDGNVPSSVKWQFGAPTAGNPSGSDIYLIRITKTGTSTFIVRGSLSQEKV